MGDVRPGGMPLSRLRILAIVLALAPAMALTGCIENMGDLKETLGVKAPLPPPAPVYEAPTAKATASATRVLVGERITFLSEGSKDAQGLPLDISWDFGDRGTARGASVSHAFSSSGEFKVRLLVANTAGLTDDDILLVKVTSADRAPTAALRISDAKGVSTLRGMMGAALAFDAIASDPEDGPLAYEWSFGDGTTSHDARAQHAYAAPGAYDVTLRVADRAQNTAVATARVLIDGAWHASGAFEATGAQTTDVPIVVAAAAKSLKITLAFDAGAGLNDIEIVVFDATGAEVHRSAGEGSPGTQGQATRELTLDTFAAPGAWSVQVLRERGLSSAWTLDIIETL